MNEVEILRGLLQAAMDDEDYSKARQYMNLIEYIQGDDDMPSAVIA